MIHKNSLALLNKMLSVLLEIQLGNDLSLEKTDSIQRNFADIRSTVKGRPGIYTIKDEEETMKIVVVSVDEIDDHTKSYLITIANSGRTFKREEIFYPDGEVKLKIIQNYGKEKDDE